MLTGVEAARMWLGKCKEFALLLLEYLDELPAVAARRELEAEGMSSNDWRFKSRCRPENM